LQRLTSISPIAVLEKFVIVRETLLNRGTLRALGHRIPILFLTVSQANELHGWLPCASGRNSGLKLDSIC
jgi:hypothetical protein